jgi:hypothetical protein
MTREVSEREMGLAFRRTVNRVRFISWPIPEEMDVSWLLLN